jgi:hypothetical protein
MWSLLREQNNMEANRVQCMSAGNRRSHPYYIKFTEGFMQLYIAM